MIRVVGIGDYAVSGCSKDILKTFALSSCVGITVYDPANKILGMAHVVLPDSKIVGNKPIVNPAYYVDTAVPLLFNRLGANSKQKKRRLEVKIYGGANSIRKNDSFQVGLRNIQMLRLTLKKAGIAVCHSDVGGTVSRSLTADVATGNVKVGYQPINI